MSELQIAWLELIIVAGLGLLLVLSGIIINIIAKNHYKSCTKRTEGIVIQYGFPGDGRMHPIVEYTVDGTCYRVKKKFRGVKRIKISGFPINVQSKAYEDEKGWLHVKSGAITNLSQLAQQLWPIDSKMTVYYNPNNPKMSYVDRPILNSFTSILFIIIGIVTILFGVLVFFLIQL